MAAVPVAKAVQSLQEQFPGITGIKEASDWGGPNYARAIHLGDVAEGGEIDGRAGANYNAWESDPWEKVYVLGIHRQLRDALDKLGYFAECHDPGTYFAWPV